MLNGVMGFTVATSYEYVVDTSILKQDPSPFFFLEGMRYFVDKAGSVSLGMGNVP